MNENQTHRIWRPSVEPNEQILPSPGSSENHLQQQQVYTKTSLIRTDESSCRDSSSSANWRNANQEILTASQAFNNSPKPFYRQGATRPSCLSPSFGGNTVHQAASSASSAYKHQQQHHQEFETHRQVVVNRSTLDSQSSNNNSIDANVAQQPTQISEEENMAPKLVHKQYNSPIDLYSMNNIRKTIEAHTELIAPGVKGINFMKADTPVNKQSEVYKLVMEEENQHSRGPSTSQRLSPISGQPLNLPRALYEHQEAAEVRHTAQHQINQGAFAGTQSSVSNQVKEQQITALQDQFVRQQERELAKGPDKMPTCCECGQFIVGPFAKIQNRCVHPQCFNCTTCGTSLKNTGYFTVNEKLYCDIHAKQVANIMHIKYDFGGRQQVQHEQKQLHIGTSSTAQAGQSSEVQQSNVKLDQEMHLQPLTSHTMTTTRQTYSSSTSPATISTMFADRSQSQNTASGGDRYNLVLATSH